MSTTLYGKDDLTGQLTECNTLNAANVPLIVTEMIDSADGTGAGTGTTLALTAGQGGATGGGGAIFITSGGAGGATGIGGGVSITSGAGGGMSGNSGAINIVPGTVVSGTRGVITIGASGTVTDFPSGSMVDFAGATVTGLTGGGLSTNYIQGLQVWGNRAGAVGVGENDVHVLPGSCRDRNDSADITVTAEKVIDITLGHAGGTGFPQNLGIDEVGLDNLASGSVNCSQSGNTITASGAIYSATEGDGFFTPYNPRTGTLTTVGTAATFSAGSEIARSISFGDLIGNDSGGWSRVIEILGEEACTLVAAIPGGDLTGATYSIIHNATIQPDTATINRERINTLSAAGTVVVVPTSRTVAASSALTIGVRQDNGAVQTPSWLAVWVSDGGFAVVSTQHVCPLYDHGASWRRVAWVRDGGGFEGGGIRPVVYEDAGRRRKALIGTNLASFSVPVGISFSAACVSSPLEIPDIPRTARFALTTYQASNSHATDLSAVNYRRPGEGYSSGVGLNRGLRTVIPADTGTGGAAGLVSVEFELPIDGAGFFESNAAGGSPSVLGVVYGWVDVIGFPAAPTPA